MVRATDELGPHITDKVQEIISCILNEREFRQPVFQLGDFRFMVLG
jgi:hypothetical protein